MLYHSETPQIMLSQVKYLTNTASDPTHSKQLRRLISVSTLNRPGLASDPTVDS